MASVTALHPSQHQVSQVPFGQAVNDRLPRTHSLGQEADFVPRGPVTTTLNFFQLPADGSAPYNWVEKAPEGEPQRNYTDEDQSVDLTDVRGREKEFYLDKTAFHPLQGYPHNPEIDWDDDESIKRLYYPEVERVLKENTGCERVLLFDHTIRRADPKASRGPVNRAHIDQTARATKMRVELHLPDEAEELLKGRYRIINVWRPLNGAVESNPLAFADGSTVADDDTVPIQHRYPHRTGETAGVRHNPNNKWYYWSGMKNDERMLLQCYDSKYPKNRVPHSAFVDPRSTKQSKPRESIEVRALVFG